MPYFQGLTMYQILETIKGEESLMALSQGVKSDESMASALYGIMAQQVASERNRLGGDFAVAMAVTSRIQRDLIRKICGPDLIMIVLRLPKQTIIDRLTKRHGEGEAAKSMTEFCIKVTSAFEPKADDEVNTYEVLVTSDKSPDDVQSEILKIVQNTK